MKNGILFGLILGILCLTTSPIDAKWKGKGVVTSLQNIMVLMDLSPHLNQKSKVYLDDDGCQCVCGDERWSCLDTTCLLNEEECLNDELTFDHLPWQSSGPVT